MALVIAGGRVVTAADDFIADVLVDGERIAMIGANLSDRADSVIDATGAYVLPGGVDPHTHIEGGFAHAPVRDDFTSGTVAAVCGGTTTVVNFCPQAQGQPFSDLLSEWHRRLGASPPVADVGFHVSVVDLSVGGLAELVAAGVPSFKLFMAYKGRMMVDDETLFATMQIAAGCGALVMVHAENGGAIEVLIGEALARGDTSPIWHSRTRPPELEGEATARAIDLACLAGCPLYVVHVSCCEALEPVVRARTAGWEVWAETCTQYLFTDESMLERPDFEGAKFVFTPPPRTEADRRRLWDALAAGTLSVVSTDHVPYAWDEHKTLGHNDFSKIPNGAPGIEDRLAMLHHFGVGERRISLGKLVELTATQPAKLFGLYPKKGTVAVGSDADLVVFDPSATRTITAATQRSKSDYSLYEGTSVTGAPRDVLVRGQLVVRDGELIAEPGVGTFLPRAPFAPSRHGGAVGGTPER